MITCSVCGEKFDPGDLTQVFYHEEHGPVPVLIGTDGKPIRGKRVETGKDDNGNN